MRKLGVSLLLLAWCFPSQATDSVSLKEAQVFFADYAAKSSASDPAEADLYCDGGKVTIHSERAGGEVKVLVGTTDAFKRILRETAAESKSAGDYSEYSGASFRADRGMVRVDATRLSRLKNRTSPAVFHVGHCSAGGIGIVEVVFHSKPDA